ncbi:MAG: 4-hydroxythreonine-4-phosphate dehydrogenase PdxA [Solirubrobacterales bacterium]|nr:4-hydroxythreonine-4-phosphate dehydrogenase PdxA [Solirubrobacterales bacterium]
MSEPVIAITMGDGAGVGPEIIMKLFGDDEIFEGSRPLVIGDAKRLRQADEIVSSDLEVNPLTDPRDAVYRAGTVDCLDLDLLPEDLPWGELSSEAGEAAYHYIACAVELATSGRADAICTAPLNKEALHAAGHKFPGHTELLAELTNTEEVSMMLIAPALKVIHVTTHIGLIDAIERIEPGLVYRTIKRGNEALTAALDGPPRIAVCGINPHAGEHGLFGRGEEEQKIQPAVERAAAEKIDVLGPLPADTTFFRAVRGDFDLVVAMYHDQGHGPIKALGVDAGVNVTIGLPVIRTSVDHGTAFDIAGKGIAEEASMREAFRQAVELAGG